MNVLKYCLTAAFILLVIFSCKKESLVISIPSYNYFPVEKGKYIVYDVDSVSHADNDNNTDDSVYTIHFELKEVIDDTFIDGEGRPMQIIRRYRRANDTLSWNDLGVFTQVLFSKGAYRIEDNVPYHKLALPINGETSWNGNDANTLPEEIYSYTDIHAAMTLNSLAFDSTLTVQQVDDTNYIEKLFGQEIYATHVGMIYRERDDLRKVAGQVVTGTEFRMKVKSFGME